MSRPVTVRASGPLEVATTSGALGTGERIDVVVRNAGREPVTIDAVDIAIDWRPALVLEQGYQSWSVVRPCRPDDVRPERADLPDWVRATHNADPASAGLAVQGVQLLGTTDGVVGFLDGRTHLSTITARPGGGLVATALLDGIELQPGEERALHPLWVAAGEPGPLYAELADHWGRASGARAQGPAPLGWCSWYRYFAEVTPDQVRVNAALAAEHGLALVQLDDGYQAAIGDWLETNHRWPGGTAELAAEITGLGMEAGIWTAPFLVGQDSRITADHPEWLAVHGPSGHPMKAMYNPESWGGWAFALDTTQPAVLDHLRETFGALRAQGFDYHKIDFCYAASIPAQRAGSRTMTRAESLRAGLDAVRDGIGDDAFLLGCGCPFGPAVGVVDAMRVSADVAPTWEPIVSWPGYAESAPAAANAVLASRLRAPLHRRLWVNDPDCLLLTRLGPEHQQVLLDTIMASGAFVLVSDDMADYGDEEWAVIERVRADAPALDRPIVIDPFEGAR
jgi:alpha-galactosidase